MAVREKTVALHPDDTRWRIVLATMRRNGFQRSALIETLHTVQESFGYLDDASLHCVADSLRVPLSPRVWRGDVLSSLYAETGRCAYVRCLHGNGVLHQRCAGVAETVAGPVWVTAGRDFGRWIVIAGDGALSQFMWSGSGGRIRW